MRPSLPPDALPLDDTFHLIAPVRDRLRVEIIVGSSNPKFLALALNPGGEADTRIDVASRKWGAGSARGKHADLLVLADAPNKPAELQQLVHMARAAMLFTGPDTDISDETIEALLGVKAKLGAVVAAPDDEPFVLSEINTFRPPLEPFANPRAGDLLEFRFTHRRAIQNAEAARVLARFSDGAPAILGTLDPDRRFILINTSLDDRWTNAPYRPGYVPLMHRLCYDVVGPLPRVWPDWFAGRMMRVDMPSGATGEAEVIGPDGGKVSLQPTDGQWRFTPPAPGVYEASWREGSVMKRARFAVNIAPAESDLARISANDLRRRLKSTNVAVIRESELASYLEQTALAQANLTYPLLVLAMLVFIAETLLTAPRRRHADR